MSGHAHDGKDDLVRGGATDLGLPERKHERAHGVSDLASQSEPDPHLGQDVRKRALRRQGKTIRASEPT